MCLLYYIIITNLKKNLKVVFKQKLITLKKNDEIHKHTHN